MRQEAEILFKVCKHEEEKTALIFRTVLEHLVEQVPDSFNFAASEALDDFRDVIDPNVVDVWPLEELDGPFIHSEAFLIEVVGLKEASEVQDGLWRGNFEVKYAFVSDLCLLKCATVLEQVQVEGPSTNIINEAA